MDKSAAAGVLTLDLHRLDLRYASLRLPDPPAIVRLARSIAADGQLVPCIAVAGEGEAFILVDGYRRIAALRYLGHQRLMVLREIRQLQAPQMLHQQGLSHSHRNPDLRVQESVRQFFRTFRRTGSATATVKAFRAEGLSFPHRIYRGPQSGELLWAELDHSRALWLLHHPRYTGASCFGRTRKQPDGSLRHQRLLTEEWIALIREAHPGYITWDEYEQNRQILRDNAQAPATGRDRGPPREGPALLQGLAICARCGNRMSVRYHLQGARRVPDYVCQRHGVEHAEPICQLIVGGDLDAAIGRLLVEVVTPVTLAVALAVQKELESRSEDGGGRERRVPGVLPRACRCRGAAHSPRRAGFCKRRGIGASRSKGINRPEQGARRLLFDVSPPTDYPQ